MLNFLGSNLIISILTKQIDLVLMQNQYKKMGVLKPNSTNYNIYVSTLQDSCKLTPFQFYCSVGLILSDASLSLNQPQTSGRIKIQQTVRHWDFLNHLLTDVYPEWSFQSEPRPVSSVRKQMISFQTLTLPIFMNSFSFFYDEDRKKVIPINIERYLHPIVLAY
jgi:hypothetical protein